MKRIGERCCIVVTTHHHRLFIYFSIICIWIHAFLQIFSSGNPRQCQGVQECHNNCYAFFWMTLSETSTLTKSPLQKKITQKIYWICLLCLQAMKSRSGHLYYGLTYFTPQKMKLYHISPKMEILITVNAMAQKNSFLLCFESYCLEKLWVC